MVGFLLCLLFILFTMKGYLYVTICDIISVNTSSRFVVFFTVCVLKHCHLLSYNQRYFHRLILSQWYFLFFCSSIMNKGHPVGALYIHIVPALISRQLTSTGRWWSSVRVWYLLKYQVMRQYLVEHTGNCEITATQVGLVWRLDLSSYPGRTGRQMETLLEPAK